MISLQAGTIIAGGYRLERQLARGGMGSVWIARHLRLDVDVAIKFMTTEYAASPEARARFEREAKASAQLKSPNVVQVHDYGVEGDTPYIVMELLEGEDLNARLGRAGRLSIQATYAIVDQVCKALRRSHEVGLVHRDLKPANIFLSVHLGEEIVKVLDFGIAKAMSVGGPVPAGNATRTGTLIGSPYYMSPEQIRRSKLVDHRSDLWSLGVIAFQCLTGHLPFASEEFGEVLVEVCSDPIPLPSRFVPDLPSEIDRFIERALTRDLEQRFQSARELADAFHAIVAPGAARGSAAELAARGSAPQLAAPPSGRAPHASGGFTPVPVTFAMGSPGAPSGGLTASSSAAPATTAPLPPPLQPSVNTLAPAGGTWASPPSRGRRVGLVLAAASVLLALGLTVFLLAGRAPSSSTSAASQPALEGGTAAQPADPSASSGKTAAEPAAITPSATASVAAPPAPSATSAPSAGPRRRPVPTKKTAADPLDSR